VNTSNTSAGWTPFKIPPTPTITNDDVYSLTCSSGAVSSKNPSQFLQWRKTDESGGLPEGAIAKKLDVCENGIPRSYWFVVWEEEPVLEEAQEE